MKSNKSAKYLAKCIKRGSYSDLSLFSVGDNSISGKILIEDEYYVFKIGLDIDFSVEYECSILVDINDESYNNLSFIGCCEMSICPDSKDPFQSCKTKRTVIFMKMVCNSFTLDAIESHIGNNESIECIYASLFLQIAIYLLKAEERKGLVHYDLNVNNILISKDESKLANDIVSYGNISIPTYGYTITIIDFGLSRTNNSVSNRHLSYPTSAIYICPLPLYYPLLDWYMLMDNIINTANSKLIAPVNKIIDLSYPYLRSDKFQESWYVDYQSDIFSHPMITKTINSLTIKFKEFVLEYFHNICDIILYLHVDRLPITFSAKQIEREINGIICIDEVLLSVLQYIEQLANKVGYNANAILKLKSRISRGKVPKQFYSLSLFLYLHFKRTLLTCVEKIDDALNDVFYVKKPKSIFKILYEHYRTLLQ